MDVLPKNHKLRLQKNNYDFTKHTQTYIMFSDRSLKTLIYGLFQDQRVRSGVGCGEVQQTGLHLSAQELTRHVPVFPGRAGARQQHRGERRGCVHDDSTAHSGGGV